MLFGHVVSNLNRDYPCQLAVRQSSSLIAFAANSMPVALGCQLRTGKDYSLLTSRSAIAGARLPGVVPRAGFEPARAEAQRILSPSRLPIPPPRLLQAYR